MPEEFDHIGTYRILRPLGQGGMGQVYLAEDTISGRRVAIKTVRPGSARHLATIRREIRTLAQIQHPYIVAILDQGERAGTPWYAMPWIQGQTLRQVVRERFAIEGPGCGDRSSATPTTPEELTESVEFDGVPNHDATIVDPDPQGLPVPPDIPVPQSRQAGAGNLSLFLDVARKLCSAIGFLHHQGLVHCDLKPANVILRPTMDPVLVDFGVIKQTAGADGRETLEGTTAIAGTIHYMAPEQILGQAVDGRTDLYSFGCILYEMVCGAPPFAGQSTAAILSAHVDQPPQPPSARVEGVPEELEGLIMNLLVKNPRRRIGYVEDVDAVLAELGAAPPDVPADQTPRPYLFRPPVLGRQSELNRFAAILDRLDTQGRGGCLLIGGERGIGRTRLGRAFLRRAEAQRRPTVVTEVEYGLGQSDVRAPLALWRPLLRRVADACREGGPPTFERLLGDRAEILAPYESTVAQLVPPRPTAGRRLDESDPDAVDRLFGALADVLAEVLRDRPLVILLDDIHEADPLSIAFLISLGAERFWANHPLALAGFYRSDEPHDSLTPLFRLDDIEHLMLGRLSRRHVRRMIAEMLGLERAPKGLADLLARRAHGNPLYVTEYLRSVVDEGLLRRSPRGTWRLAGEGSIEQLEDALEALPAPPTLQDLARRRLAALSEAARALARAAAILRGRTQTEVLFQTAQVDPEVGRPLVDELVRRRVLVEPSSGMVQFVDTKLQLFLNEEIPPGVRRLLHRRAAEALEDAHRGHLDDIAYILADHWLEAGLPEKAGPYLLEAARFHRERCDYEAARDRYEEAREVFPPGSSAYIEATIALARHLLPAPAETNRALELLATALAQAEEKELVDLQIEAMDGLAKAHHALGNDQQSRRWVQRGLDRCGESHHGLAASLLNTLAAIIQIQGDFREALSLAQAARNRAELAGDTETLGRSLHRVGACALGMGDFSTASKALTEAARVLRRARDRVHEAQVLAALATVRQHQGNLRSAVSVYEKAIRLLRRTGQRFHLAVALTNIGAVLQLGGRLDEARKRYLQAAATVERLPNARFHGAILANLAAVEGKLGELEEARRHFAKARAYFAASPQPTYEAYLDCYEAQFLRRTEGLSDRTRALVDRAIGAFARAEHPMGQAVALCEGGHVELAAGGSGHPYLQAAEALVDGLTSGGVTEESQAIERLRRAQQFADAGGRLYRGERWEDLPPGLRRVLTQPSPAHQPPEDIPHLLDPKE